MPGNGLEARRLTPDVDGVGWLEPAVGVAAMWDGELPLTLGMMKRPPVTIRTLSVRTVWPGAAREAVSTRMHVARYEAVGTRQRTLPSIDARAPQ
ncbi:hypothetical protein PCAR4_10041 [Paraburkholderia caribensis]|nr:hypothetical protein PCAR4_10041 [Paraburkholderia caribensis]